MIKIKSVKKKIFLKRLSLIIIPQLITFLILIGLTIFIIQNYIYDSIYNSSHNMLFQSQENIELILDEIDSINIIYDLDPFITNRLKKILSNDDFTHNDVYLLRMANSFLSAIVNGKPYLHSIYIYYDTGDNNFLSTNEWIASIDSFHDVDWYYSYKNQSDKKIWSEKRNIKLFSTDPGQEVITLYKRLDYGKGVVIINMLPSYIENAINSLTIYDNQMLLVVDEKGEVLFSNSSNNIPTIEEISNITNNDEEFFTSKIDRTNFVIHKLPSNKFKWTYISIVPLVTIYKPLFIFIFVCSILLIISVTSGIVITYLQTNQNYKLINNMIDIIEAAQKGIQLPLLPEKDDDIYSYITQNILKTFIEQNYLKTQLSERKYRYKTMELMALQSQMNPHFLFNTLENIYWKVICFTGKPNEASYMIENLSDILKYSLSSPTEMVTLEEELHYTKCYVDLLQARYTNKFIYICEIDEEILDKKIIRLLFQPIIENAIYHGIKEKKGQCKIKVSCFFKDDFIHINIIDTGLGIGKETLLSLNNKLKDEKQDFEHIGLVNTYQRLMLIYSDKASLKILSKEGCGTVVKIKMPSNIQ